MIIGHSVGATLARRVYLAAYKTPTNFQREDELASQHHRPWVETVERVVLLAAFNRGWSLTARTSWRYSALFNFIGLVGHIGSATEKAPAIFDFRLGAPFMVQTRLHWLAYRRRPRDASDPRGGREPIFVQLIGNEDDLISPIDQVDISADGKGTPRSSGPVTTRMAPQPPDDFFVIPMANTDHQSAVALTGEDDASGKRRGLFIASLEKDRAALKALAMDPSLLADQVDPIDETVKDTVFVIHGIRDDGFWTHRIAGTVRKTALVRGAEYRGWTPTYGYFAMLPFVLPWIRRQKVEWFMDQYVSAFAQYPSSDFHFVGHSNGTYLAARALEIYPAFHLKRVFFAGSVVRSNYAWGLFINAKRVETLQNVCAAADWVVAWLPKSLEWLHAFDLGGAGFDGFHEADENPSIHELKYVSGCHSSAIIESHWPQIANFVVNGTPMVRGGEPLYRRKPNRFVSWVSKPRLFLPVAAALALLGPTSLIWWALRPAGLGWKMLGLVIYFGVIRLVITRV